MNVAKEQPTGEDTTCPWCSADVPANAPTCPSCGASLRDAADGDVLGVTQIDPSAISRASRIKPGRIATWLGAEQPLEGPNLGGRIEPPSKEVREEMLRLELAAIDAEIEAKKLAAAANRDLPDDDAMTPAATAAPEATPEAATAAPEAAVAAPASEPDANPDLPDDDAPAEASEAKPG